MLRRRNGWSPERRYIDLTDERGPDECWPWLGATNRWGYGKFGVKGRVIGAHRFGFEMRVGPIPPGLEVCHSCDNPPCQNPDHWFLGTRAENAADMVTKGRGMHGERNHRSRLTRDQVSQIRDRYAAGGVSYSALARDFSVSKGHVALIVTRRRWRRS